jgi:universal stress protein E
MAERILCPINFTVFSHHAVQYAVALARSNGSTITGLHVVADPPAASVVPRATSEQVEQLKAETLRALQEAGAPSPEAIAVRGDPADEIVHLAASLPADLVVMPSHGRTGFASTMCGSVTTNVLRHSTRPVLTVPRTSPTPDGSALFRRILCAVDFSPASLHALSRAERIAAATSSPLVILHVLHSAARQAAPSEDSPASDAGEQERIEMWRRRLRQAVGAEGPPTVQVTERVCDGDPADEILRVAEAEACNLIVIGAHGGNPLNCTLNKVVRRSTRPVLTVRR